MPHLTINKRHTDTPVRRNIFRGNTWAFDKNMMGTHEIDFVHTVSYFICTY